MIRSMTGYGRGECNLHNRKIVVEIKAVNHRYNDIAIKLPRILNPLEDSVRKKLSLYINRGRTDVYISMETLSADDIKISFNEALADLYVDELNKIMARYGGIQDGLSLELIAKFPDLLTVDKSPDAEKVSGEIDMALQNALGLAIERFVNMRETEGEALKKDICGKALEVRRLIGGVKERAPAVAEEYALKLKIRIMEMLAKTETEFDESRILTEIAFFADKSCIDEEITRLYSHICQLEQVLSEGDSVGRKLDFLMQEMNREVNTIGSKSNDLVITKIVIDLKSELEKIREQIQNIE